MAGESTRSVVTAVISNALVTVAKFIAFAVSGSGAMLSEGIHSVADTSNQALLLFGLGRSRRGPDATHPYGYGRARFFWGLVSALGIFFLGAGITLWHGIDGLLHPQPSDHTWVTWAVLAFAVVVEGYALLVAWHGTTTKARAAGVSPWQYAREGRDPTLAAVLLEDSAAVFGICLAGAGIGLEIATGWPGWDAIASVLIGLLLGGVAIFLVAANRAFLLSRSIDPRAFATIEGIIEASPVVADVSRLQGVVITLGHYRVAADVDFDGAAVADLVLARNDLAAIRAELLDPERTRDYLRRFAAEVVVALGDEIDDLEERVRAEIPAARHLDLEAD